MNSKTKKLVGIALFTAIVVVLQALGGAIKVGQFTFSFVLVPIVVGAAVYGVAAGAWLGFVFGVVVLLSGDAGAFMAVNVLGTILTVLVKGALCGLAAGGVYKLFEKKNRYLAVFLAAVVCPTVNTGVFLLGCIAFFMDTIRGWAEALGFANAGRYMVLSLAGINYICEIVVNIILAPVISRLIKIGQKN